MKKINLLTFAVLASLISGCSSKQPTVDYGINSNLNLKNDRDYIAYVARDNYLNVIDGKEHKLYKSCKLDGIQSPGGLVMSNDGKKAYILQENTHGINGYDINSCEKFFSASFNHENIIGTSMFSFNISPDDKQLYAIANEVEKSNDRYKVMDPKFMVYNISDGLNAKPIKSFKAPRQISVMGVDKKGVIYAAGPDIYKINPNTQEISVVAKHRNWDRKNYSPADSLAMWPIGQQSNEFMMMYTAAKFENEKMEGEPQVVWGATRIDLNTGVVEQSDFAPFETIMFTGMTSPTDHNLLYGVLTDLSKFDRKEQKLIKRVDLDHTYYSLSFATDGHEFYIAGLNHLLIVNPDTLDIKEKLVLPYGDIGAGTLQVFRVK